MSKIDLIYAFRNVPVRPEKSAVFGYAFGEWVVIDRRLEFGWTNSPRYFCLLTSALEHSHAATAFADAVVTEQGRAATAHINVQPPSAHEKSIPFPRGCKIPNGSGGGANDRYFIRFYVDDGILVEVEWFPRGERCKRASESCASDHFRLLGERGPDDPPPLVPTQTFVVWATKLVVLGWEIDTVAMTIAAPAEKLADMHEMLLLQWPPERVSASEKEVRSLIGKLLHLCTVVRIGRFSFGACYCSLVSTR